MCNTSSSCQACKIGFALKNESCLECTSMGLNCKECTSEICTKCEVKYYIDVGQCLLCSTLNKCVKCNGNDNCT